MPSCIKIKEINRIIDANLNRLKEGLRVCEEITRFVLNHKRLTSDLKKIRHRINSLIRHLPAAAELLEARESHKDIGKYIFLDELKRRNLEDIFFANIQRAKESIRALEEFSKLINTKIAARLKILRYDIYEIEKKAFKKLSALRRHR